MRKRWRLCVGVLAVLAVAMLFLPVWKVEPPLDPDEWRMKVREAMQAKFVTEKDWEDESQRLLESEVHAILGPPRDFQQPISHYTMLVGDAESHNSEQCWKTKDRYLCLRFNDRRQLTGILTGPVDSRDNVSFIERCKRMLNFQ